MKNPRFKICIFLAVALFIALILTMPAKCSPQSWDRYVVEEGDTLWGITSKYNMDNRKVIADIKSKNGIDTLIKTGQVILIPVY